MSQNNDSIAVMLLCCRMSATRQELFDPLSPPEYHALAQTLQKKLLKIFNNFPSWRGANVKTGFARDPVMWFTSEPSKL